MPPLVFLAVFYGGRWLLGISIPQNLAISAEVAIGVWLIAAFAIGTVVHELGHALAVRLVGERVLGMTFGSKFASRTFNVGTVPVSIGVGLGGSVAFRGHRLSAARRAAVWLCADALAADLDQDDRASALAIVAMARHARLLSGRQQLDEALALDPGAQLVSEAAQLLDGGWETALAAHDQRRARADRTGV